MSNTSEYQFPQNIFQQQPQPGTYPRPGTGVMQDKGTPGRRYAASSQPPNATIPAQVRPKHHGSQKRRVKELSGCVSPEVFDQVERMRDQWARKQGKKKRLSRSGVVGTLVKRGVQGHIDMQYGAMLEPIIKNTLKTQMQGDTNRLAYIAVQSFYAAEQARLITTELLRHIYGGATKEFQEKITAIRKEAHTNLSRKMEERE